ncbi:protein of unknown function [Acidithiobacillus ferrivorans]|uniref:Uncharacterized protein n=2 Tax=Acidithiobacillus ferrivorans TaxID=160808 RepID=A0ABY1MJQ7_9PROT|nr:protein of unknown function [Acidithiobacillus ferrivorans]
MRLGLRYPAGTFPAASHDGIAPYSHVPVGTDGRTSGSLSMENSLINTTTYATSRRTNSSYLSAMPSKRQPSALRAAHQFLNDCKRCSAVVIF